MFRFLGMLADQEARRVALYEQGGVFVSTVLVNDGSQPYETAVAHDDYNSGRMVIVEAYDSKSEAEDGHQRWVAVMTAPELPESLTDCANSEVQQSIGRETFKRVIKGGG